MILTSQAVAQSGGSAGGSAGGYTVQHNAGSTGGYSAGSAGGSEVGLLHRIGDRLKARRPTVATGQDQVTVTRTRERSLLRTRSSAAGNATTPTGQRPAAPSSDEAPTAPAEKTSPPPKTSAKPQSANLSPELNGMLAALNDYRSKFSLAPLSIDPILQNVAQHRVGQFSHQANGMWSWQEATRAGFPGPAMNTTVTDNLSNGCSAVEAVHGWASEDNDRGGGIGHNRQMRGEANMNGRWINCHFNVCGLAHRGPNTIAIFGRREDQAACDCLNGGKCICGPNCNCGK